MKHAPFTRGFSRGKWLSSATVVAAHVLVIVWLTRLTPHAPEVVVPVQVAGEVLPRVVSPPPPPSPAPAPIPPKPPAPGPQPLPPLPQAAPPPSPEATPPISPQTLPAMPSAPVAPNATAAATTTTAPAGAPPNSAPSSAGSSSTGTSQKIEPPSTVADYLHNPKPTYPAISRKMGEQGVVVLLVLVGADGSAQEVKVRHSSGYPRLDQAALAAVKNWRFVPGKRGGVPQAMTVEVPLRFDPFSSS